jgi:hypothetical protein
MESKVLDFGLFWDPSHPHRNSLPFASLHSTSLHLRTLHPFITSIDIREKKRSWIILTHFSGTFGRRLECKVDISQVSGVRWNPKVHHCVHKNMSNNLQWTGFFLRPTGFWEVEAHTFYRQLAHGGVFVSLVRRQSALHTQEDSWVDPRAIVRLEGLGKLKNPMI